MIEKWCKAAWTKSVPAARKLSAQANQVPAGVWIVVLVTILIGAQRWKGLYERYSGHRNEIANAIGSAQHFFGIPHPNRDSSRVLYLGTSKAGFAAIAADVAGRRAQILREWRGENTVDSHDQVSSFSPDGSLFAYYFKGHSDEYVAICNAQTGEELGRIQTRSWNLMQITWVTSEKLVCVERSGLRLAQPLDHVHLIAKENGKWKLQAFALTLVNSSCFAALSGGKFAWVDWRGICEMNTASNITINQLFDGPGTQGKKDEFVSPGTAAINSYKIILDTTVGTASNGWTIAFWKDGAKLQQDTYSSNPTIHYVGVGAYGAMGKYLDFKLTDESSRVTNTIYHDTFSRKGLLNGSIPRPVDTARAKWNAFGELVTDGSGIVVVHALLNGGLNNAFLPFIPQAGHIYTLSVQISAISGNEMWLAFGYSQNALTNKSFADINVGAGFLLQRAGKVSTLFRQPGRSVTEFNYSQQSDQFLVTCREKADYSLWHLRLKTNAPNEFVQLTKDKNIHNAQWLADGKGYAYLNGNTLVTKAEAETDPARLTRASMNDFSVAPSGNDLFFFGIVSNEPSAGLWRYDVSNRALAAVVPWSDYAGGREIRHTQPSHCVLQIGRQSIDYYVFRPAHFNRNKKYPIVLCDTPYVHFEGNYIQGRSWPVISLAACGAYVVVVDRRTWFGGIQDWSKNVMAVYNRLVTDPTIDSGKVYLYGVSAETSFMSKLVEQKPELWKGALFLNPSQLPDLSALESRTRLPKIFISAGANEGESGRFAKFREDAGGRGIKATIQELPDSAHFTISTEASRARMAAMADFVFNN